MKHLINLILIIAVLFGGYKLWNKYLNYNFGTITEGKVYKSGAIKPDKIEDYTSKHGIKTVIDLRNESTLYSSEEEAAAIAKIDDVQYFNIKSKQVPDKTSLTEFFEIMDNQDNYPVLIHCYHGLGRTMLYVALYRIEYEGFSNEEARSLTRDFIVESPIYESSFGSSKKKGQFLINYVPRSADENATINLIK